MLLGAGDALGCGVAVGELDGFIVVVGTAVVVGASVSTPPSLMVGESVSNSPLTGEDVGISK